MNVTAIHANHQLTRQQLFDLQREQSRRMLAMRNHKNATDEEIGDWFHLAPVTARRHMLHETRRLGYEIARRKWTHANIPEFTPRQAGTLSARNAVFYALADAHIPHEQIAAAYQVTRSCVKQEVAKQRNRAGETPKPQETPPPDAAPLTEIPNKPPQELPTDPPPEKKHTTADMVHLSEIPEMVEQSMRLCLSLFGATTVDDFEQVAASIVMTHYEATHNAEQTQHYVGNLTMALMKCAVSLKKEPTT